ncbi:hypothetical protein [Aquibacillus sediminis]|uniref:hypothetical protein n=1 Tax=Aquibacillus sediminis TaxID=2574734 RepID=UPI00110962EE|nr:hypothetical protein [Aquibacillus sediminis]
MGKHFNVERGGRWLKINRVSNVPIYYYEVYVDNYLATIVYYGASAYVDVGYQKPRHVFVVAYYQSGGIPSSLTESFILTNFNNPLTRDRTFQSGDILVASDNVNQLMTGYVGHSAIVVDEGHLIESPGGHPAIQKDTIQQFLDKHPEHAHFRPKSAQMGKKAANYAEEYIKEYQQNGKDKPVFSFTLSQELDDPWEYVYCSKLIYLCYTKGADYEALENDFLWYSPEDLYSDLIDNDDFELVYEHDDVGFHINT